MSERYFNKSDGGHLRLQDGPGLYITADEQPVGSLSAGSVGDTPVWWREVANRSLEEAGAEAAALGGMQSITLAGHAKSPTTTRLSVAFAHHLSTYRADKHSTPAPCVISYEKPQPPAEFVRLPHLVAITERFAIRDEVIWEVLPHNEAISWLGMQLPDQAAFENRLPRLLQLRQIIRENRPIKNEPYQELTRRLAAGRYLSILFTYENADLLSRVLEGTEWHDIEAGLPHD